MTEEKKSLFSWWRKKPAENAAEPTQPAPVEQSEPAQPPAEPSTPESAPEALPALEPEVAEVAPAPAPQAEPLVAEPSVAPAVVVEPPPVPEPVAEALPEVVAPAPVAAPTTQEKPSFFARLKQGLSKTSASLGEGMASLFLGKKAIDDDLLDDLETRLLTADVGVEATTAIIGNLTKRVARKELADSGALYKALQEELVTLLKPVEQPLVIDSGKQPYVILVVGVNGVGKTTTIGKLAKKLQLEGKKVMLAAGDTFRAAAVEQLQVWGERNNIAVIAQHTGADSASVIFDAVQAAKSRGIDVLIADTAGRLHTKDNLMEELKKVRRVIGKLDETAPHEVLLVLDAGTGQNAINQAKQFNQTVNLTGLALTKLDGTAKGGVIFALAKQFGLP
ncbi:MAG: signal recognition particle-docking protein FtsY, partial [Ectopseudomonas oleovorans]